MSTMAKVVILIFISAIFQSVYHVKGDPVLPVEMENFSPAGVRVDNHLTEPIFGSVTFLVSLVCPSLDYGSIEPEGWESLFPAGMCMITRLTAYYIQDNQPKYCTPYTSPGTAHNRFKVVFDETDSRNAGSCRVTKL